jgi:hypothetical protein
VFNLFGEKPDHPMYDMAEARRLLDELPQDDATKALEEITFWLESIKNATGFTPELRIATIFLLDEAGQPRQTELLQRYLSEPHLRDFHGLLLWKSTHAFALSLAAAYAASISEIQHSARITRELKEQIPLICVRQMRAISEQMKLELMRYLDIDADIWRQMCACYRYTEMALCSESMVLPYPGHVIHTSPQREMLCALVMYIASPGTLAHDQLEVSFRIAGRLNSFFDLKTTADADCPYLFDLSADAPPHMAEHDKQATADMRFFGATRALPALQKIIDQNENDPIWRERRFGSEFTPAGKLTVLKHLMTYWAAQPPHRHMARREISAAVEVTHGFRVISQIVTHIDAGDDAEQDVDASKKRAKIDLTATSEINYITEMWGITDMSTDGIGVTLTGTLGAWIKIGDLCAVKPQNGQLWWVGMIRRLHTDAQGRVHVGIELLAKKPASVWLRVLGKGADLVSHWETSSGSFAYDYLPAILLPDEHNAYLNATMLMESGSFVADALYQMMMGEKSRDIKLTRLIAEGEDYEQVQFEWLKYT